MFEWFYVYMSLLSLNKVLIKNIKHHPILHNTRNSFSLFFSLLVYFFWNVFLFECLRLNNGTKM